MIVAKMLALIGLYAPSRPDDGHLVRKLRQANAASFQNTIINSNAQRDALDRIDQTQNDHRIRQIERDAQQMRETLTETLSRLQ